MCATGGRPGSRVWDAFLFFNELDLLECRLYELEDSVYRHVLVESPVTFQGKRKPLYYLDNMDRFARWNDRIVHVIAAPEGETPWEREQYQREAIFAGLGNAWPSDLIMLSDVDEIPRGELVNGYMYPQVTFLMSNHIFAANLLHPEGILCTSVQYYAHIKTFHRMRRGRYAWPRIPDAGWHLSYLGGSQAIREKVLAYSHTELTEEFLDWLDKGQSYDTGVVITSPLYEKTDLCGTWVQVDDSFPRWIKERKCPASWVVPVADAKMLFYNPP